MVGSAAVPGKIAPGHTRQLAPRDSFGAHLANVRKITNPFAPVTGAGAVPDNGPAEEHASNHLGKTLHKVGARATWNLSDIIHW